MLDDALENFCDRHWPCEYIDARRQGGRCVNVRSGHGAKGHQSKSGKLLATGDYVSSFTFAGSQEKFQNDTYEKLVSLSARVRAKEALGTPKEQAAAEIHRELVLPSFYEHASRGDLRRFVSHTVCFSCLIQPPEHALPYMHVVLEIAWTDTAGPPRRDLIMSNGKPSEALQINMEGLLEASGLWRSCTCT
jgi:hypothetical protein